MQLKVQKKQVIAPLNWNYYVTQYIWNESGEMVDW